MTPLHSLQIEASLLADSMNPQVVATALTNSGCMYPCNHCNRCDYGKNKDGFKEVLYNYTVWKIRYQRLMKRSWAYYDREERMASYFGGYENVYAELCKWSDRLDYLWPCPECLLRYNPTRRTRRQSSGRRRKRK